jgi:hypothetical protein
VLDEFDQDVGLVHLTDQENNLGNIVEVNDAVGHDLVHGLLNLPEDLGVLVHEHIDVFLFVVSEVDGILFQMEIGFERGDDVHCLYRIVLYKNTIRKTDLKIKCNIMLYSQPYQYYIIR